MMNKTTTETCVKFTHGEINMLINKKKHPHFFEGVKYPGSYRDIMRTVFTIPKWH